MENMTTRNAAIAYLIHTFPVYSTTFISYEIDELRKQGVQLRLFGVQPPGPGDYPEEFRRFFDEMTYIFPMSYFRLFSSNAVAFLQKPFKYLKALAFALMCGKLSFKDRLRTLFHFFEAVYLYPELRSAGCLYLHVHFLSGSASIALFLNKLYGTKYSLTAHGTDIFVEKVLLAEKISNAEFTRVGTEYNRRYLSALFPEGVDVSIYVIPFGIDLKKFKTRKPGPFPNLRLLNVGRLTWQKAQDTLLKACARLREEQVDFHLTIVGDGELRAELERLKDSLGLSSCVSMPGKMTEQQVVEQYRSSDIFILSSVSEGFGIVLLEAMASGLAVIAPAIKGIPEIINDGVDGLLFKPGSIRDLKDAIMELAADPEKRARLAKAAYSKVTERFQLKDSINGFHSVLKKAADIR